MGERSDTLTPSQEKWLQRLDEAEREVTRPYGDNFRTFERVMKALTARGLAKPYVHGGFVITDVGRAWLHPPNESERPLDASGDLLVVGSLVVATPNYQPDGALIEGVVVRVRKRLVTVKHATGPRAGQSWRSAAWLWRRQPGEVIERPEPKPVRSDSHPVRTKQCKACPWRKDVVPDRDIPGGYCASKHAALSSTVAKPGELNLSGTLRMMACHESPVGKETPCVGWLVNQLGPGNNIGLRLMVMRDPRYHDLETVGEQHETLEDTLPESER